MTPIVLFPSIFYFFITLNLHSFIRILLIGTGTFFVAAAIEDYLFLPNTNLIQKMSLGKRYG
jgi:hypothetical protein